MNKRLYIEGVRQLKIPGIIGSVILSIIAFFTSWAATFLNRPSTKTQLIYAAQNPTVSDFSLYTALFLAVGLIFVPIMMVVMFSFLHKRNSSDFYHAIPVKRQNLFLTYQAAVLTWAAVLILLPAMIILIVYLIDPYHRLEGLTVLNTLLTALVIAYLVAGAFSVGVSATGTGFTNFVVSLLILFVPRIIIIAIFVSVSDMVCSINYDMIDGFFGIRFNALFGACYHYFDVLFGDDDGMMTKALPMIYTFLLATAYNVWGLMMFTHRKSEVASTPNFNRNWQTVTRIVPAFCVSMISTIAFTLMVMEDISFDDETVFWLAFFYVAAIVVYFLYELITSKKWSAVARAWKTFPFLILANALLVLIIVIPTNILRAERFDANRVTEVRIDESYSSDALIDESWKSAGYIQDTEVIEILVEAFNSTMDYHYDGGVTQYDNSYEVRASFKMNGHIVRRHFYVSREMREQLDNILTEMIQNDTAKLSFPDASQVKYIYLSMMSNYGIETLTDEQLKLVYASWTQEVNSMSDYVKLINYAETCDCVAMSVEFANSSADIKAPICSLTPKTLNLLLQYGRENSISELTEVLKVLKEAEASDLYDYYATTYVYRDLNEDGYTVLRGPYYDEADFDALIDNWQRFADTYESWSKTTYEDGDYMICIEARFELKDSITEDSYMECYEFRNMNWFFCIDEEQIEQFVNDYPMIMVIE